MKLTAERLREFKESFAYNDRDNDGKIVLDELIMMLDELEAEVSSEEARIGFRAVDTDRDGAITLDEFIDWWQDR